jgi:hypothetical protein
MGRFLIDIYPISPFTSIREEQGLNIQFNVWILDTCCDNSFMLMILASIYLQLHLYGPIVNKSHQKKEILIQT